MFLMLKRQIPASCLVFCLLILKTNHLPKPIAIVISFARPENSEGKKKKSKYLRLCPLALLSRHFPLFLKQKHLILLKSDNIFQKPVF